MASPNIFILVLWVAACKASWNHVPSIPAGHRTQYQLLRDDGSYKWGYDSGDGLYAQAIASPDNEVQGSYLGAAGRSISYTSGVGGYRLGEVQGDAMGQSTRTAVEPSPPGTKMVDTDYDEHSDSSYDFGFDTGSYQRKESSDAKGNIRGSYSYMSNVGGNQRVSFSSNSQQGDSPTEMGSQPYKFDYATDDQSRQEAADTMGTVRGSYSFISPDGHQKKVEYEASDDKGFVIKNGDVGSADVAAKKEYVPSSVLTGMPIPQSKDYRPPTSHDGSYSFAYNTGDQSRQELADAKGNVQGSFDFVAVDDGQRRKLYYEAGADTGFLARGDHLPKAPSVEHPNLPRLPAPLTQSSHLLQTNIPVGNAVSRTVQNAGSVGATLMFPDNSYSFSFNAGDHARQESSDAAGNVQGSFSFVAKDDGQTRKVNYEAGIDKGFVASGDHLPKAPMNIPVYTPQSALHAETHSFQESFRSGSSPGSVENKPTYPDGSYSFAYDTSDQSRQESSDTKGNVKGSFSFVAKDDGQTRKVEYEAGAEKGFVARGEHLPSAASGSVQQSPAVLPNVRPLPPLPDLKLASLPSTYLPPVTNPSPALPFYEPVITKLATYTPPAVPYHPSPLEHSQVEGGVSVISTPVGQDGSYSFSYDSGDQSRQETGDAMGNVQGSFSFKGKEDGLQRRVEYKAGAEKGFIAHGEHLPRISPSASGSVQQSSPTFPNVRPLPQLPNTKLASLPTPYLSPVTKPSTTPPLYKLAVTQLATYTPPGPPAVPYHPSPLELSQVGGGVSIINAPVGQDGSYSFSYDSGDQSRQETGDAMGNVQGSFSFRGKEDGQQRRVEYEAGAEKGFRARGDHLPTQPEVPTGGEESSVQTHTYQESGMDGSSIEENNGDAAYSYSYETDSSKKQESSDSTGNVVGMFSFLGPDGEAKNVQYTVRGDEGFVATGKHLPKAGVFTNIGEISLNKPPEKFVVSSAKSSSGYSYSSGSSETVNALPKSAKEYDSNTYSLKTFLLPNEHHKFGYIFDAQPVSV